MLFALVFCSYIVPNKNTAFIGAVEAPNVNRTVSLDTLFDIAKALDIQPYKLLVDD